MFSMHWARGSLRRRYIIVAGAAGIVLFLSIVFNLLWIAPEKGKVSYLSAHVQSLKNEKKALMERIAREGWHTHGDGHYHSDAEPVEEDIREDDGDSMARKILASEKPLGLKAFQLRILEETARVAAKTGIRTLSYQKLMEDSDKVVTIDRQPEEGLKFREDIYRYIFRIDLESDYSGITAFFRDLESLSLPVVVQGFRFGGGSGERIRIQLDMAAYYRQKI